MLWSTVLRLRRAVSIPLMQAGQPVFHDSLPGGHEPKLAAAVARGASALHQVRRAETIRLLTCSRNGLKVARLAAQLHGLPLQALSLIPRSRTVSHSV